jgi:hypothetical protein
MIFIDNLHVHINFKRSYIVNCLIFFVIVVFVVVVFCLFLLFFICVVLIFFMYSKLPLVNSLPLSQSETVFKIKF